jgi:hypothetical protein
MHVKVMHGVKRVDVEFTFEMVSCMFGSTQRGAARHFGVAHTTFRRICRALGIVWPKASNRRCKKLASEGQSHEADRTEGTSVAASVCTLSADTKSFACRTRKDGQIIRVEFTVEKLSTMFGGTQKAAADHFGVGLTTMKKICSRLDMRWPKSFNRDRASNKGLCFLNLDGM